MSDTYPVVAGRSTFDPRRRPVEPAHQLVYVLPAHLYTFLGRCLVHFLDVKIFQPDECQPPRAAYLI
jgi:hypothetical protein